MPQKSDDVETVAQPRPPRLDGLRVAFTLVAIEGPAKGKVFRVDACEGVRVLVGQGPACEIRIDDRELSRRHAALEVGGDRLRVTDLGSTNGTHVNGACVLEAILAGGETLRLGASELRVETWADTQPPPWPHASFGRLLGASPQMRSIYPLCDRLAKSNVPVVIEGETGTGKEVLAEALHECGPNAAGPYVVFDCTAVQPGLAEAELFGHERGAFTGAVSTRKGLFELAHGGTLFIDEIGDLDASLQPKLLRAVERGEVRRVGGDRYVRVDVRILAATRRDLDQEVSIGRFRDDLFHRLAVTRIELPPLRKRTGDVVVLARHFWLAMGGDARGVPPETLARWERHTWPGNVRELRNAVARLLALGDLTVPTSRPDLGSTDPYGTVVALGLPLAVARQRIVAEFERRYIEHVLAEHGGDTAKAAAASGIARRYFNILRSRAAR